MLAQYSRYLPPPKYKAYFEPFAGGAAVFFELIRRGLNPGQTAVHLSDVNEDLINLYRVIQSRPEELLDALRIHAAKHDEEYFYAVRALHVPSLGEVDQAARILYLNRTCYNGLYRVNSKGLFNVPFGRYKNPTIVPEIRVREAHQALTGVKLSVETFHGVLKRARKGDFVYFDPPYQPLSTTSNFTAYSRFSFGEKEQRELADVFARLDDKGVRVLLSNSETPLIRELYQNFTVHTVSAPRFINSNAELRSAISEVLVMGKRLSEDFKVAQVG